MKYMEMTIEDALKFYNGNKHKTVLVSVSNLEEQSEIISFVKANKKDCETIIKTAQTIAGECDELINQLKCFSERQNIFEIQPKGKMSTILFPKIE